MLAAGVAFTLAITLTFLNKGIKYYNQMEVIPIYGTMSMIWGMTAGMICANEIQQYSAVQLAKLLTAISISVLGIWLLLRKTN